MSRCAAAALLLLATKKRKQRRTLSLLPQASCMWQSFIHRLNKKLFFSPPAVVLSACRRWPAAAASGARRSSAHTPATAACDHDAGTARGSLGRSAPSGVVRGGGGARGDIRRKEGQPTPFAASPRNHHAPHGCRARRPAPATPISWRLICLHCCIPPNATGAYRPACAAPHSQDR